MKMWSGKKYSIVMAVLMICVMSVPAAAQLADTPWPMFHHDLNHTGLSQYHGPDTPAIKWNFSTGNKITGSAVIGEDGTIYIGTRNYQQAKTGSKLCAIYPNGTEKWQRAASHFIDSTPAVASDGTVYVGSWDKCFCALYPNGTKKWEFCTPCGGFVLTSPAIAPDGTIYVGSNDKKLYAIYPNGTEKWNYPTGQSIQSSPAIGPDGIIYVGSCDKKLYAIYPNGTEKWNYCTGQSVQSSPAIGSDGIIYVGSCDKKLYAIYSNGTLNWAYTMGGKVESSPAIDADGTTYVGSKDGKLYAIYPNGTLNWVYTTGGEVVSSPAIDADGTIYVGSKDGYFYAIKPNNTLLWRHYTGNEIRYSSPAIASDGTVYIGNWGGNLYAFGPEQPLGTSNRLPVLDAIGDRTINEAETVVIDLNASDPDGDSLTYSCNKTNLFTDFDTATGAGNWTTNYNDFGTHWVNFGVSDGNGGIDNETILITVLDSNRAPVLDPVGDKTVNESEAVMIDLNASDLDGDTLTYSCNRTDLFTDFNPVAGTGNWTTDYYDVGTYQIDFGVSDGNGGTDNETITIAVSDANRPPTLDPIGDMTVNETDTVTIDLNASDQDGDSLIYSCNRTYLFTDFDSSTGAGNWTTDYDDAGVCWVDFGVSDGTGGTANETIRIEVQNVNKPPVLDPVGDKTLNETETLIIDLNASDPDGDSVTYSCNRTDMFTDFDPVTGAGNWTTDYDDAGVCWVDFGVSDSTDGTANETIWIEVQNVNRPPVLDPVGDKTINETETLMITLNAADPDGDSLTYSALNLPPGSAFDLNTQAFSWTPTSMQAGTYPDVHFEVSDGTSTDSENITITVNNVSLEAKINVTAPPGCIGLTKQFGVYIQVDPMGASVYGVEYKLTFDPTAIHAEWQTEGDFLKQGGANTNVYTNNIDNDAGTISFAATRKDTGTGVTENGTLSTIHFTAIKQGANTTLILTDVKVSDPDAQPISVDINNSEVEVCDNKPPVAIGKTMFKYNNVGTKYISKAYFDGSESNSADGNITNYRWYFGDGNYGAGETYDHVYGSWNWNGASYDPFEVILTVEDDGTPMMDNSTTMFVNVYIAGDANGDGEVDIFDATIVGLEWDENCLASGSWGTDDRKDKADLNNDCEVDIFDAVIIGANWDHIAW